MKPRQSEILNLINDNKKIEVAKLAELLNVSQVTIRKDLAELENSGTIKREHGYAILNETDDINMRLAQNYEIKQKIASKASEMVQDGETVIIESGSSCTLLAAELARTKKDITIITNSAFIANYIRRIGSPKIILLGGEYQNESQVMVGPMMRKSVETFFVDKAFVGTDGYTQKHGFMGKDYMRSEAVKDMAKQAEKLIILTDSDKFGRKGLVSHVDSQNIYKVITDENLPAQYEKALKSQGIKIEKA